MVPCLAGARDVYVTSQTPNTVSVIDSGRNAVFETISGVGEHPREVAIVPDGTRAYVGNRISKTVTAIDTRTRKVIGEPIPVGDDAISLAISPDGKTVYVGLLELGAVAVIDTGTNQLAGEPIKVGGNPRGIAFTPDGSRAYVAIKDSGSVSVIDTRTRMVVGGPIAVGDNPRSIAIAPDGSHAYVTNAGAESVSVIDTRTNVVVGEPIKLLEAHFSGVAITPDGSRAYMADETHDAVAVLDTRTSQFVGEPIKVGENPRTVAITPNGRRAYVTEENPGTVSVIDLVAGKVVGEPIPVGAGPFGVAIVPNQAPVSVLRLKTVRARPGVPVVFDAFGSRDPDGDRAPSGTFSFGDRRTAPLRRTRNTHTYAKPGAYRVRLTLTDEEGCSTRPVFTGQTAYCNGAERATRTKLVKVAHPGVRMRCPKSAGRPGCRFALQAVAGNRHKAQSAIAHARVKAGSSRIVSLVPKRAFRAKLARAGSVTVRIGRTIRGATSSRVTKLKIVR